MNTVIFVKKFISRTKTKTKVKRFKPRRKQNKKCCSTTFITSWRKFFDHVSVDGLFLIGGSDKRRLITRAGTLIMLLICLGLAVYQCKINVDEYQEMKIRTTIRYDTKNQIEFPAVSICPAQLARKSMFGTSNVTITFLSLAFARNEEEQKFNMKIVIEEIWEISY